MQVSNKKKTFRNFLVQRAMTLTLRWKLVTRKQRGRRLRKTKKRASLAAAWEHSQLLRWCPRQPECRLGWRYRRGRRGHDCSHRPQTESATSTWHTQGKRQRSFNGQCSTTTWISRYQTVKPFWILMEQETRGVRKGGGTGSGLCFRLRPNGRIYVRKKSPNASKFWDKDVRKRREFPKLRPEFR